MKKWLNDLKIAIIEEDVDKVISMFEHMPNTDDIALATTACALIQEAICLVEKNKNILSEQMLKIKSAKHYLEN